MRLERLVREMCNGGHDLVDFWLRVWRGEPIPMTVIKLRPLRKDGKPYKVPYYEVQVPYYPTMEDRKWAAERLAERGWGKPKQDVVIDDHETTGFQIVFRQWPQGYDPLAKGEKPYRPRPDDREAHGKLALPPLKDPTPHKDGDGNGSH